MKKDKINLAICDDEILILKELERFVRTFAKKNSFDLNISTFTDAEQLVEMLEKEETKMWHFSPMTVYSMWKHEKETGEIVFPEE